jgi:GNAT superfamily N-acetyltransferase
MDKLQLHRLTPPEIDAVAPLARTVWLATYPALITQAQIDFMLADRYAAACIQAQLDDPDQAWWTARQPALMEVARQSAPVGFAHATLAGADCKLDKLYVHPQQQRQGIGRALQEVALHWARERGAQRVWLQVNRGNTQAVHAYTQYGFRMVEARVFAIGGGFVMDDYVMEKSL